MMNASGAKSFMKYFLPLLLALRALICTVPLLMAPSVAAQGKHIPQAKTQPEYEAYNSAIAKKDPEELAQAADDFAIKFPNSELRAPLFKTVLLACYEKFGDWDRAVDAGRKVLKFDPDDPTALVLVADSLLRLTSGSESDKDQRLNEATAMARRAIQTIDSNLPVAQGASQASADAAVGYLFSTAYSTIGLVEFKRSDFAVAECDFRRSISVYPENPDAVIFIRLAVTLDMLHKYAEALAFANRAIRLAKDNGPAADAALQEQKRVTMLLGEVGSGSNNVTAPSSCGELPQAHHALVPPASGSSTASPGLAYQVAVPTTIPEIGSSANSRTESEFGRAERGVSLAPQLKSGLGPEQTGRFVALVIGIDEYRYLPKLKTAVNDAEHIAASLHDLYGFDTRILRDANRNEITKALNEYRRTLDENANFLVYYAGHGFYDKEADKAYWLPADAEPGDTSNWIIADEITTDIKVIAARHILIISDSCYSGGLTREISPAFTPQERGRYLQKMIEGRSRTLMSSGGLEPVSDGGSAGHSVFANALLRGLTTTDDQAFSAEILFQQFIRVSVAGKSDQTPQYGAIRNSGHDSGDFVFVRVPH